MEDPIKQGKNVKINILSNFGEIMTIFKNFIMRKRIFIKSLCQF